MDKQDPILLLVEHCKKGKTSAQYELYHKYCKAMFNTALRILAIKEDAEDALQEAFVEAFNKISSFKGEATFGSWLKTIVVNKCLGKLRNKKLLFSSIEDENIAEYEASEFDYQNSLESVEKIKLAIEKLPHGFRIILNLHLFEGYDHAEIAQILSINEVTSRTQYMRGKNKLQQLLKGTLST